MAHPSEKDYGIREYKKIFQMSELTTI